MWDWVEALVAALELKGFIPRTSPPLPSGIVPLEDPSEGSVDPNPLAVDLGPYPQADLSLTWPEGNPRLIYPLVD